MNTLRSLIVLFATTTAAMSLAQLTGNYDSSNNTMPVTQGWRVYGNRAQGPNDFVQGGVLNIKPASDWNYYGRAVADPDFPELERPFDIRLGFDIKFTVKVNNGRFSTYVSDDGGRGLWLDIDSNGDVRVNFNLIPVPFTSSGQVHSPGTRFHTYRIWGDGSYMRLAVDGAAPVFVTPTYLFLNNNRNLVYWGDIFRATSTDAEVTGFSYILEGVGPDLPGGGGGIGPGMTTRYAFEANAGLNVAGTGSSRTIDNFFTPGFSPATPAAISYRATTQGGVSTAGFGVSLPNDSGSSAGRGIDGDGANGALTEQLDLEVPSGKFAARGEVTLGLNIVSAAGDPGYVIEAYNGSTLVGSVTGTLTGATNSLVTIPLNFGNAPFNRVTIRNSHQTSDAFVLHGAALDVLN